MDHWDNFVRGHPRGHALQLSSWGQLKSAFGWSATRVHLTDPTSGAITAGAQLLFRPLPYRLGTLAYLPMGPLLTDPTQADELWPLIHRAARRNTARFLKWEAGIYLSGEQPPNFQTLNFRASPQTIQPPNTILIDITGDDEEAILARMNQGTRRKIRTADKNGVRIYAASAAEVDQFNALLQVTGERKDFGVHEPAYYQLAYDLFVPAGDAVLLLAEHEGDTLAGIFIFAVGQTAWYLYGASANIKRNLMATYRLHWEAIQWARRRGCRWYDLWGIPDEPEAVLEAHFQERSDGLWGVYGSKRGWGGIVQRSVGAWDYIYNPLVYRAYQWALRRREG